MLSLTLGSTLFAEAVARRCSVKKVFLEISQNSHENTWASVSLLKKRLWHGCFPVNFANFLGTPLLTEQLWWLLLYLRTGGTKLQETGTPSELNWNAFQKYASEKLFWFALKYLKFSETLTTIIKALISRTLTPNHQSVWKFGDFKN